MRQRGDPPEVARRRAELRARLQRGSSRSGIPTRTGGPAAPDGDPDGVQYRRWAQRVDRLAVGRNLFEADPEPINGGGQRESATLTRGQAQAKLQQSVDELMARGARERERESGGGASEDARRRRQEGQRTATNRGKRSPADAQRARELRERM